MTVTEYWHQCFILQISKKMAEEKLIPTRTNISTGNNRIEIFTYYLKPAESFLQFFVDLENKTREGVNFVAGDLGYQIENLSDIFSINGNGELIVSSIFAEKYSIDENGDLIYTE